MVLPTSEGKKQDIHVSFVDVDETRKKQDMSQAGAPMLRDFIALLSLQTHLVV